MKTTLSAVSSALSSAVSSAVFSAAVLFAGLSAPAHADSTQVIVLTLGSGVTQTGSFSDTVAAVGSFTDDYTFNSPPPLATVSFASSASSGVQFTSVTLLTYGTLTPNALSGSVTPTSFSEASVGSLNSGLYKIEVKGMALVANASYSGTLTALTGSQVPPPVPEPASGALLLLGLGATGAAARARRGVKR